jgi:hypothetical protein
MGALDPDQGEERLKQVVRAQRDEPLVLDPAPALQRLLRRRRQVVVLDRREHAAIPVQGVHVPLNERLLALGLKRHHEARPREARAHQEQPDHRRDPGDHHRRLAPVDLGGHTGVVHLRAERLSRQPQHPAALANVITNRRLRHHSTVLLHQAIVDPLRGVPLLTRRRPVRDQDLIDPLPIRPKRRRWPALRTLALRR